MKSLQVIKELIKEGSTEQMGTFAYVEYDSEQEQFVKELFGKNYRLWNNSKLEVDNDYLYSFDPTFMRREVPDAIIENIHDEKDCIYLYLIE